MADSSPASRFRSVVFVSTNHLNSTKSCFVHRALDVTIEKKDASKDTDKDKNYIDSEPPEKSDIDNEDVCKNRRHDGHFANKDEGLHSVHLMEAGVDFFAEFMPFGLCHRILLSTVLRGIQDIR